MSNAGSETLFIHTVLPHEVKQRLDHCLVRHQSELSRSYITNLIAAKCILVNGQAVKAGYKLRPDDQITVYLPPREPAKLQPEEVAYEDIFEDEHILVISKPPGLVVHPAAGHRSGTLVHGLLYRFGSLPCAEGGRPGIVHRLDKDTSGIMVAAKSEQALRHLTEAFKNRIIEKTYYALLERCPDQKEGRIIAPIGRHPVHRQKMAVLDRGRYAVSRYTIVKTYANGMCLARVGIETGRTHQIRVHMASMNTPIAGDELYGGKRRTIGAHTITRQMLHAYSLAFPHPVNGDSLQFKAPLWPDLQLCLDTLTR
ncbi:MAG: RluA family pseudouridine synthase [Desulfobulbus propionicus]|nr:MAG: RluA family pseudouridine synthase [Desulfobulbus propionicus]